MLLDLTKGIVETPLYHAWKFPGGEIHFRLKDHVVNEITHEQMLEGGAIIHINTRLKTAMDVIFLAIVVDTIYKYFSIKPVVNIGYMPYQQADRDFGVGECFSLKTITNLLNALPVDTYIVFDPHSDVTPALLNNIIVVDNTEFIKYTLNEMMKMEINEEDITILSPDAGAYKKIFKLCEKIGFKGPIESANKCRSTKDGSISGIRLSTIDFGKAPYVLIIDDICVGGRTFIELAKHIPATNLYLAVSHGIFSNGFGELAKRYKGVFTTNSWQTEKDIRVLVAELAAQQWLDEGFFINIYNEIIHEQISESARS
jgi:ribose-phosphate pyrophosphokinase